VAFVPRAGIETTRAAIAAAKLAVALVRLLLSIVKSLPRAISRANTSADVFSERRDRRRRPVRFGKPESGW